MTEYVKSTNFASKDALSTGNPLKIVKGTEIDTEFNNIATAVVTKADLLSPVFTGTPTAPTASFGTSSTQLATTAFVQAALALVYPVGSIYTNAAVSTNPATLLGFGTWAAFGAGRVMVGFNAADPLFDTLEETGGAKDAIVVSHTHTITDPGHVHGLPLNNPSAGGATGTGLVGIGTGFQTDANTTGISVDSSGASAEHANLQPYITVRMWKRTA